MASRLSCAFYLFIDNLIAFGPETISFIEKYWYLTKLWAIFLQFKLSHFGSVEMKYFIGAQQTIIYRLVMRNLRYKAYFLILGLFWWEKSLCLQNRNKNLPHRVNLLGQLLFRDHAVKTFRALCTLKKGTAGIRPIYNINLMCDKASMAD